MKKANNNYITYVGIVNWKYERFKLNELTVDNFKYLTFVKGLTTERDLEIRFPILSKLEADSKLMLQMIAEEFETITNLKYDTAKI